MLIRRTVIKLLIAGAAIHSSTKHLLQSVKHFSWWETCIIVHICAFEHAVVSCLQASRHTLGGGLSVNRHRFLGVLANLVSGSRNGNKRVALQLNYCITCVSCNLFGSQGDYISHVILKFIMLTKAVSQPSVCFVSMHFRFPWRRGC